ncbi:hypothetical protein SAMN05428995_104339 [Loktanella sp. DSM 29012]|uniref:hypothetical protein n=1 Tax=Loktanella sp. DSM 29012 TaxID=1881056 RepID=UPI0008BDF202|nr:hypothetical protein [Loktanella sp. DSM 29012]SEQ45964.1 hypothetical protein SAMN05428995_104339 [Loktanella sp. DSM 29012]
MAEPMSNARIEDVLSSIRRLVAEDNAAEREAPRPSARIEKFVLTPALRVDHEEDARDSDAESDAPFVLEASHAVTPAEDTSGPASLLSTIAELEAAVSDQAEDWEDDGTGTELDKSWSSAGFRGDVPVEDAIELDSADRPLGVPQGPEAWPATLSEAARLYRVQDEDEDDSAQVLFRHHRHRAAADHEAVDQDYNDDLIEAPDERDPEAEAALHMFLEGGLTVKNDQLQEIVRQIVREELQGTMGERITRNVRKLVRREIQRVLSSSDLT